MNRKETTEFLGNLLKRDRLYKRGKYWSSEVTLDYGSNNVKRVDFMEFEPPCEPPNLNSYLIRWGFPLT